MPCFHHLGLLIMKLATVRTEKGEGACIVETKLSTQRLLFQGFILPLSILPIWSIKFGALALQGTRNTASTRRATGSTCHKIHRHSRPRQGDLNGEGFTQSTGSSKTWNDVAPSLHLLSLGCRESLLHWELHPAPSLKFQWHPTCLTSMLPLNHGQRAPGGSAVPRRRGQEASTFLQMTEINRHRPSQEANAVDCMPAKMALWSNAQLQFASMAMTHAVPMTNSELTPALSTLLQAWVKANHRIQAAFEIPWVKGWHCSLNRPFCAAWGALKTKS